MEIADFKIDCTGDVVVGDTILFEESVWTGNYTNPVFSGKRTIIAEVIRDSYGEKKQQHTFTLKVLDSTGVSPLDKNINVMRKGRNVYKDGTKRLSWKCPEERVLALGEKHSRGDIARSTRVSRRSFF